MSERQLGAPTSRVQSPTHPQRQPCSTTEDSSLTFVATTSPSLSAPTRSCSREDTRSSSWKARSVQRITYLPVHPRRPVVHGKNRRLRGVPPVGGRQRPFVMLLPGLHHSRTSPPLPEVPPLSTPGGFSHQSVTASSRSLTIWGPTQSFLPANKGLD